MVNCNISFITGCSVGLELIDPESHPDGFSGLIIDVFIIRLFFLWV
jgi:hypothetical protein